MRAEYFLAAFLSSPTDLFGKTGCQDSGRQSKQSDSEKGDESAEDFPQWSYREDVAVADGRQSCHAPPHRRRIASAKTVEIVGVR